MVIFASFPNQKNVLRTLLKSPFLPIKNRWIHSFSIWVGSTHQHRCQIGSAFGRAKGHTHHWILEPKSWANCFTELLVGGWALPLWKMMEWKSVGMMTFPTEWKNNPNVPNHQPIIRIRRTWLWWAVYIYICMYIYIYICMYICICVYIRT